MEINQFHIDNLVLCEYQLVPADLRALQLPRANDRGGLYGLEELHNLLFLSDDNLRLHLQDIV